MSTKTNFKRIALVAVAALGLGVLSSVPSQATISGPITASSTNGTAFTIKADTTTAGTVTFKYVALQSDSLIISATLIAKPGTDSPGLIFTALDTATSTAYTRIKPEVPAAAEPATLAANGAASATAYKDSAVVTAADAGGFVSASFRVQMDSQTGSRTLGTYTWRVIAVPHVVTVTGSPATNVTSAATPTLSVFTDVSIVISASAAESTVASAATSSAFIGTSASAKTADTAVSVPAAVSATDAPRAYITTVLRNALSQLAGESLTVTTNIGLVGKGSVRGKSVVLSHDGDDEVSIWSDGTAGTATITLKSTSVTFPSKSVVFYAAAPATIVASALNTAIGVGPNPLALGVVAKDANGNNYGGTLYVSSDALTVVSDTATACTYNVTNSRHECGLTGVIAGDAKITVRDKATGATIVSSNAVSYTVTSSSPASVKLAFDKATYAPGEKATLLVSVLDSAGKSVPANTFANLFATGGITLSAAAGNGSETVTAVSVQTVSLASYALGTLTTPVKAYTLYMPSSGGTITAKATGGSSLPLAGQVEVSTSAAVTDSGAAALAAVTALATTVASLRTLITTLTNLVLKIQKKVKA
jgi:hypothetical protein